MLGWLKLQNLLVSDMIDEINPYMCDDETVHKMNTTHFDIENSALRKDAMRWNQHFNQFTEDAAKYGVEFKMPDRMAIYRQLQRQNRHRDNKDTYQLLEFYMNKIGLTVQQFSEGFN